MNHEAMSATSVFKINQARANGKEKKPFQSQLSIVSE